MRVINMNRIIISKINRIQRNYSFQHRNRLIHATIIITITTLNHPITPRLLSIRMDRHILLLVETSIIFLSSSNSNSNRNHNKTSNYLKSRFLINNQDSHRNLPMPNLSSITITITTTELVLILKKLVSTLLAISSSFYFASSNNLSNHNKTPPKVLISNRINNNSNNNH